MIKLFFRPAWLDARSRLLCKQHLPCSVSSSTRSEVVWRFDWRTFYVDSWKVKIILACQEVLKRICSSMTRNRLLFIQIPTLPSSMHHRWKELFNFFAKEPMRTHEESTFDWKSHLVKGYSHMLKQFLISNCSSTYDGFKTSTFAHCRVSH